MVPVCAAHYRFANDNPNGSPRGAYALGTLFPQPHGLSVQYPQHPPAVALRAIGVPFQLNPTC